MVQPLSRRSKLLFLLITSVLLTLTSFVRKTLSPSSTASNAACRSEYLPFTVPYQSSTRATLAAACACVGAHASTAANTTAIATKTCKNLRETDFVSIADPHHALVWAHHAAPAAEPRGGRPHARPRPSRLA